MKNSPTTSTPKTNNNQNNNEDTTNYKKGSKTLKNENILIGNDNVSPMSPSPSPKYQQQSSFQTTGTGTGTSNSSLRSTPPSSNRGSSTVSSTNNDTNDSTNTSINNNKSSSILKNDTALPLRNKDNTISTTSKTTTTTNTNNNSAKKGHRRKNSFNASDTTTNETTTPRRIRRSNSTPSLCNNGASLKNDTPIKRNSDIITSEQKKQQHKEQEYGGILYKRRDVFRNQWRPRYFVLSRESGMLRYYLVPSSLSLERGQSVHGNTMSMEDDISFRRMDSNNASNITPSGNPRGSFYLPGCSVYVNDKLSRPGKYYAFTILTNTDDPEGCDVGTTTTDYNNGNYNNNNHTTSNTNTTPIHLATRTHEERMQWIQRLSPVCNSKICNNDIKNDLVVSVSPQPPARHIHHNTDINVSTLTMGSGSNHATSASSAIEDIDEEEEDDDDEEIMDDNDDQASTPVEEDSSSDESIDFESIDILHENVPTDIRTLIDEKIRRILHFFRESTNRKTRWKACFRRKNVNAFQKRRRGSPPLIRVESFINHHPFLLLQHLIDTTKRTEYENNLRLTNRLKVFNNHTFLDYYAYKPTKKSRSITARDFCVVTHWRVLPNKSILYVSFSFPDQKFCPLDLDHVRADLICNAFLFQPSAMNQANSCFVKRIFSTDLNGKLPTSVVNAFTLQQIKLLSSLTAYLDNIQPPELFTPDISNETVNEIVQPLLQQQEQQSNLSGNDYRDMVKLDPLESSYSLRQLKTSTKSLSSTKDDRKDNNNQAKKTKSYISFPFWLIVASGLLLILPTLCVTIYKWILIPIYQHILFIFFLPLTGLLILQNCNDIAYHKHAKYARTHQRHNFVVHFPFFIDGCVLFFPVVAYHLATTSAPQLREIVFVVSLFVSLRSFVLSKIGPRFKYHDGSSAPMSGHKGLGTGVVTCRFDIELKGILRYISAKKEANKKNASNERSDESSSSTVANHKDAEIAVTHIVIKAAARAISEFPQFNGYKLSIPMLSIQGYFPYRQIDISVAKGINRSSSESNYTSKLCSVDQLTIKDIATQVAMKISSPAQKNSSDTNQTFISKVFTKLSNIILRTGKSNTQDLGPCVILTSPNSENSDVEIDVAPSLSTANSNAPTIIIVVGGVRILSQHMNKSSSSNRSQSSNTSRPFLHMSISMNCPASSPQTCRKFAERIQKLAQLPEICDEVVE